MRFRDVDMKAVEDQMTLITTRYKSARRSAIKHFVEPMDGWDDNATAALTMALEETQWLARLLEEAINEAH